MRNPGRKTRCTTHKQTYAGLQCNLKGRMYVQLQIFQTRPGIPASSAGGLDLTSGDKKDLHTSQTNLEEEEGGRTEPEGNRRLSHPNLSFKVSPYLMYCWAGCAGGSQGWNEDWTSLELPRDRFLPTQHTWWERGRGKRQGCNQPAADVYTHPWSGE